MQEFMITISSCKRSRSLNTEVIKEYGGIGQKKYEPTTILNQELQIIDSISPYME